MILYVPKTDDVTTFMKSNSIDTYVFCAPETI